MPMDAGTQTRSSKVIALVGIVAFATVSAVASSKMANQTSGTNQIDSSTLSFDVVSVKENKSYERQMQLIAPPTSDFITIKNATLFAIVVFAYNFDHPSSVKGLPEWANGSRFDITGKVAPSDLVTFQKATFEQKKAMFQRVLADRFHLTMHFEDKVQDVFELTVVNKGPKLTPSPKVRTEKLRQPQPIMYAGAGRVVAEDATMTNLVFLLSDSLLGREVVDKTNLQGKFDFTLTWTPDDPGVTGTADGDTNVPRDNFPAVFRALTEQLGLRVQAAKEKAPILVVDHVAKPAEN